MMTANIAVARWFGAISAVRPIFAKGSYPYYPVAGLTRYE